MFPRPALDSLDLTSSSWGTYHSRVSGRPEFSGEFPLAILAEEILTPGAGQLRGLLGMAGNMVRNILFYTGNVRNNFDVGVKLLI